MSWHSGSNMTKEVNRVHVMIIRSMKKTYTKLINNISFCWKPSNIRYWDSVNIKAFRFVSTMKITFAITIWIRKWIWRKCFPKWEVNFLDVNNRKEQLSKKQLCSKVWTNKWIISISAKGRSSNLQLIIEKCFCFTKQTMQSNGKVKKERTV